jgi:hypothetical protein
MTEFKISTGGPRYSRTFYLRIRLFTLEKMIQNDNFQVENWTFNRRIQDS